MNAELDALQAARKKELRQKTKLLGKIAELDPDDDLYDSMYEDLHSVLRQHAQSIAELDDKIEQVSIAIHNAGRQNLTAEQVRTIASTIFNMMDIMPAEDERTIMRALVDSIQIYPKPLPNGLILKKIRFCFPLECDLSMEGPNSGDDDGDSNDPPSGRGRSHDKDSPSGGGGSQADDDKTPDGDFSCAENPLPIQTSVPVLSVTKNSTPARGVLSVPSTYF